MSEPLSQERLQEERELDRLYLRSADGLLSPKQKARFALLREKLIQPILAAAHEKERREYCWDDLDFTQLASAG